MLVGFALGWVPIAPGAAAPIRAQATSLEVVRSFEAPGAAAALAFDPGLRALVVAEHLSGATRVSRVTTGGDAVGSTTVLGALDDLAAGPGGILARQGGELVALARSDLSSPRADPVAQGPLSRATGGIAYGGGRLWQLEAAARALVTTGAGSSRRIALGGQVRGALDGLAFNDADGLVYVGAPDERRVYGVDVSGAVRSVLDYSQAPIGDPAGFAFAPSADGTDDPTLTSFFVADTRGTVVEMSSEVVALAVTPEPSVLVQTIDTSAWVPPSPDPAGITWMSDVGRFVVADSEVDEMTIFQGANLFEMTPAGASTSTGNANPFSTEPTGVSYRASDRTLFVSDDNANRVTFVQPGPDGRHGTSDDTTSFISTFPPSDDSEDVAYDSATGDLFVVDGVDKEVYRASPGPNSVFGGGDDVWTSFDVGQYGARDPEGIAYDAENDTLLVVDQGSRAVLELSKTGTLLRIVDIRSAPTVAAAGIEIAPGSQRPERNTLWITDRVVDNGPDPNENDGKIFEVVADTSGNTTPVVDSVRIDQTTPRTNDVLSVSVTAHDDDGDPLTYRYQWRKNGVQVPGQTFPTFDLSVPGHGNKGDVISVRVVAFDGVAESAPRTSSQVTIVNSPPAFSTDLTDRTSEELAAIELAATAVDPDADPLTYEATGLPPGLSIDAATGVVSGTIAAGATATSPYATAITVREGATPDATDSFTWTVVPELVNQPPVVHSVDVTPAAPRTADVVTAVVDASDPDANPIELAYQWAVNGSDVAGATSESLDLSVAGNGDKGDVLTVRVVASDGTDSSAPVTSAGATVDNSPPVFDADLGDRAGVEGDVVSLPAGATDPDTGDVLAYQASGLPAGLGIDPATGLISGTIAAGAAALSPHETQISVGDGTALVGDAFTWTVTAPNFPPATPAGLSTAVDAAAVVLDWADNTEPDLAGYHVYRAADEAGPYTRLTSLPLTVSQYSDAAAPLSASYYLVTAVDTIAQESLPAVTSATRSIAFVASATQATREHTAVVVSRPAGIAEGDFMVAAVVVNGAPGITAPSGWTLLRVETGGSTVRQALYVRRATASEPASWTWTLSARRSSVATILAYRGVESAVPVDASSGLVNTAPKKGSRSVSAPSLTTTVQPTALVGFFGVATNTTFVPPAGMREAVDLVQSAGKQKATVEGVDQLLPTVGSTGSRTATSGVAVTTSIGQLVALRAGT